MPPLGRNREAFEIPRAAAEADRGIAEQVRRDNPKERGTFRHKCRPGNFDRFSQSLERTA